MGNLKIVIHEAEEGGYWAEAVGFPGCVSEGDTLEEVKANIIDAFNGCMAATLKWAMCRQATKTSNGTLEYTFA